MQNGFEEFFQLVGLLIKLVRQYILQKSSKAMCSKSALKSPKKINLHKLMNASPSFYLEAP